MTSLRQSAMMELEKIPEDKLSFVIPSEDLVSSSAPFGLVFAHMFGPTVGRIIMGLMLLSCFGSLLGWQFTIANVFKAGSDVGYFPAFMKKITSTETPLIGMVTITVIQSLFSLMTISRH